MTIKKGDTVHIIAGKEKGKQGVVEKSILSTNRVIVTGINIRKHHLKPTKTRPKGGIAEFPGSLSRANVMIVCPHCSRPTRIKHTAGADNKKYRYCSHCQASLDSK